MAGHWGHGRWRVYDSWTGLAIHEEHVFGGDLQCTDWSSDGRWIALGGKLYGPDSENQDLGRVRIYDATNFQRTAEIDDFAGAVNDLAISPDKQLLVTASEDGTLRTWKMPSG